MKLLVSYVFHIYNNRVKYFFDRCIYQSPDVDFLIICNDENVEFENYLPSFTNIKILKRDNVGIDFGGWSDGILTNDLYKKYNYFIFCNSSIIGPFFKPNFQGKWTDIYIDGLMQNNCKLFGSTINTLKIPHLFSHIQTYIFSMNLETLEFLIEEEIFTIRKYCKTIGDAVISKEILMSRKILDNGWNIGCLLPIYKDVDFTLKTSNENSKNIFIYDDVMWVQYLNNLWTCEDLVFIKGNRIPTNIDEIL